MEIAIEPIGSDEPHMSDLVARCVKVLEASGLPYRVGAMSSAVQGSLAELIALTERMHQAAWDDEDVPRIVTTIRIDDTRGVEKSLDDRVKSVMEEAGAPA